MRKKPIGVTVNLPTTAEGMEALREAIMEMNDQLIACGLRRVTLLPLQSWNTSKA